MSNRKIYRIDLLLDEAERMPRGDAQVNLLTKAVKQADATGDLPIMFQTRLCLTEAATFSGQGEKAIANFAWCLTQLEKDPDQFSGLEDDALWQFKYILQYAAEFPQFSRQQFEQLRQQMEKQFDRIGFSQRPVQYARLEFATHVGDQAMAAEAFKAFRAEPRDEMADCEACEADLMIEYHDFAGDPKEALAVAAANLSGKLKCEEVPHRTFCLVLRPLALLSRYDEADQYQKKGYRLIRDNPHFLRHVALQIAYLSHRNQPREALGLLERHLVWALKTHELLGRYYFFLAARRALTLLAGSNSELKCRLPKAFPLYDPAAQYDVAELISWFDQELDTLGNRFDERNGNEFCTKELVEYFSY